MGLGGGLHSPSANLVILLVNIDTSQIIHLVDLPINWSRVSETSV